MIWNPWRRVRELTQLVADHERHIAELQRGMAVSADRYDRIRDTNLQLRDALELYRNA